MSTLTANLYCYATSFFPEPGTTHTEFMMVGEMLLTAPDTKQFHYSAGTHDAEHQPPRFDLTTVPITRHEFDLLVRHIERYGVRHKNTSTTTNGRAPRLETLCS